MKLNPRIEASVIVIVIFNICVVKSEHMLSYNACEKLNTSLCKCDINQTEPKLECRRENSIIVVKIENGQNQVTFDCHEDSSPEMYSLLPDIELFNWTESGIESVIFEQCPLPESGISDILDKLGVRQTQALVLSSGSDLQVRRDHLKGLNSLRYLLLLAPIFHLPEDTFDDIGNLTSLVFKSVKTQLPMNIFQNLLELEQLSIDLNVFNDITPGIFRNQHKLKRLSCSKVRELTKASFIGASSLTDLSLSHLDSLEPNVFDHLKNMESIELISNQFIDLPIGLFSMNTKLNKIRLLLCSNLKMLPAGLLAQKSHLTEVSIENNRMQSLPGDLFKESSNIRDISFQTNRLKTLPDGIFSSQTKLKQLDLSENQLTELPDSLFSNARSLKVIKLSENKLNIISQRLFSGLTNLTEVDLSHNQLVKIAVEAFEHTNLHVLNLEYNGLSEYSPSFDGTRNLTSLFLGHNHLTANSILWSWYHDDDIKLKELDLSYNQISSVDIFQIIRTLSQSITVNLSNNNITKITGDKVDYSIFAVANALEKYSSLNITWTWTWILNHNPIKCDCGLLYFMKLIHSKNPTIRRNLKIEMDELRCDNSTTLKNRLVSGLKLEDLVCPLDTEFENMEYCPSRCNCSWRPVDEAAIFNCSNANLTEVPALPSIQKRGVLIQYELNIENNRIRTLPKSRRTGYEQIVKINARNNSMEFISDENLPPNVTAVDISMNHLYTLDGNLLRRLNGSGMLQHLILAGNPWTCECESDFVKFLGLYQTKVDYRNITCKDNAFLYSKSIVCPIDRTVTLLTYVIVGFVCLMIGAVVALYYKYQQEVKVFLFAHNLCMWFVTEEDLDKDKKYDAFISFSHKDEQFVTEVLVPELENGLHSYKICLHMRDWIPGEFISDQIVKTVEDSRRTIIVLSPNFIQSVWGRTEFQLAHQKSMNEGRMRLIVIIYGDVGDTEQLDPELKAYLKTNTYVEWGDKWFFDKLRYALPHKTISNS